MSFGIFAGGLASGLKDGFDIADKAAARKQANDSLIAKQNHQARQLEISRRKNEISSEKNMIAKKKNDITISNKIEENFSKTALKNIEVAVNSSNRQYENAGLQKRRYSMNGFIYDGTVEQSESFKAIEEDLTQWDGDGLYKQNKHGQIFSRATDAEEFGTEPIFHGRSLNSYGEGSDKPTGYTKRKFESFTPSEQKILSDAGYVEGDMIMNNVSKSFLDQDSGSSFKSVNFTMVDEKGNRIGTKTATTKEELDAYSKDPNLVKGTIDKPSTKQFESKAEEEEYNAEAASTAIDIGKTMNKGTYNGKLDTKELVRLENAAIARLSTAEKTSLAKDEDYQIIADEITGYSKRLNDMAKEGKLPTGVVKTAVSNVGRYFPDIGKLVGMDVTEIKENLKIQGEGANTIAEIIKIVSGLAATDKEFSRQFKANIGSFFADPSMLAAELDKTQAQINKRTKARRAKWRSKGIIQRFEPKTKDNTKEEKSKYTKDPMSMNTEEQVSALEAMLIKQGKKKKERN